MIGFITLDMKTTGKRSAGNPHAPFDEAGAGNVTMAAGMRATAKAMEYPPEPKVRAPVLDPTGRRARSLRRCERKEMIDATHDLSINRQAELLAISHSNVYYLPRPTSEADLVLMRRIDELHMECPFAGSRMLRDMLRLEGFKICRQHVRTLMAKMGIHALYRGRDTSAPHPAHKIYPYLLKGLTIDRPNQCWATDITYSTPRQRSPPARGLRCLSMSGMHVSTELMLQ